MAFKIGTGKTVPQHTDWIEFDAGLLQGVLVDVDTSDAGFSNTPSYVVSLHGTGHVSKTTGGSEVLNASSSGFRIVVRYSTTESVVTPEFANFHGWHIVWIGVEE